MSADDTSGLLQTVDSSVKEKVEFFEGILEARCKSPLDESGRMMQHEGLISTEHVRQSNGTQDDDLQKRGNTAISSTPQKAHNLNGGVLGTMDTKEQVISTNGKEELAPAVAMEQPLKSQGDSISSVVPGTAAAEARDAELIDAERGQEMTPTKSESSPISRKHPQTAPAMSSSSVGPLSASQDFTGSRKSSGATVPEPFRFSLDSRPRRSSDGVVQVTPDGPSQRRPRSSSQTDPISKVRSSGGQKVQTMLKPFNLESLKRHEKALEQLHAEIAAKEAEESAPRGFRARPILKPDAALPTRVVAPPTKPSAFKLSVEDRAERRDKFKKQVEEREQQLESEREKMLQDLKKELDKEEKHVRRNSSFKAAPARITPDEKVFKPKLGQSPKTTPRAPVLGLQRRHSTGSQEGTTTPTTAASATPGTSLGSSKNPSRPPSKPASPRVSKPPSPVVGKAPSPVPGKVPSPRASKASTPSKAPSPARPPSPGPATTPSSRLSKPAPLRTPVQKPSASTSKPASPRLTKPASPKSGPPKRALASSASSPIPASAAVAKVSTRRNSDNAGEVAGKPGPNRGVASPRVTRSPAAGSGKQTPRPLSASKPNVDSTRTPTGLSQRGMTRPQSASARKNTPSPAATKPSPRKILNPKADNKAAALEDKEAAHPNLKSAPPDLVASGKTDDKEAGATHGKEMLSEPPAESRNKESSSEVMQLEQKKSNPEAKLESPVEADVAEVDGQTTKLEANGIPVLEASPNAKG